MQCKLCFPAPAGSAACLSSQLTALFRCPSPPARRLGGMPIMVRSRACHLAGMTRQQLVSEAREEANEAGGYFICNGIERIIRCLVAQRRHYIMALRRGAYHKRGANYTDAATLIRWAQQQESKPRGVVGGALVFAKAARLRQPQSSGGCAGRRQSAVGWWAQKGEATTATRDGGLAAGS